MGWMRSTAVRGATGGAIVMAMIVPTAGVRAQPTGYRKAAKALSALALARKADLEAALGEPILAVEDGGGVSGGSGGFESVAYVTTGSGAQLEVRLASNADVATAKRQFESLTSGLPGTSLDGAGDEGVAIPGLAVVRKGAQVLQVQAEPDELLQQQVEEAKEKTGDAGSALQTIEAKAGVAAPALAEGMTGDATKQLLVAVPEGGVDVCKQVPASAVESILGKGPVTASPALAQDPPGFACSYSGPFGTIALTVVTAEQLAKAVPASDVYTELQDVADRLEATAAPGANEVAGEREVAVLLDQACPAARVATVRDQRSDVTPPKVKDKLRKVARKAGREAPTLPSISDILRAKEQEMYDARNRYLEAAKNLYQNLFLNGPPLDEIRRAEDEYNKKALEYCKLRLKLQQQGTRGQ